jgi:hypothetical protein
VAALETELENMRKRRRRVLIVRNNKTTNSSSVVEKKSSMKEPTDEQAAWLGQVTALQRKLSMGTTTTAGNWKEGELVYEYEFLGPAKEVSTATELALGSDSAHVQELIKELADAKSELAASRKEARDAKVSVFGLKFVVSLVCVCVRVCQIFSISVVYIT